MIIRALPLFAVVLLASPAWAQPGATPPAAPTAGAPPAPAPAAEPTPSRHGFFYDMAYGAGAITIPGESSGDAVVHGAFGAQTELGFHIGPHASLFVMSSVLIHHYETGNRYARWVWSGDVDSEKWIEDPDFWKRWLTITIPMSYLADSMTHVMVGTRIHLSAAMRSPYFEGGGGIAFLAAASESRVGVGFGGLLGGGWQIAEHASLGIRGLVLPVGSDGAAYAVMFTVMVH